MGLLGRTGLDRFAHGSVTERTLRTSPAPVLTVRETTPLAAVPEDVLVATDGSDGARAGVSTVEATLVSGSPHRAIVDYAAEAGVDLTVVGTHGRTGVDRLLLGSAAERVVRTAGTPVLALKAADAESAETDWTAVHQE